MKCLDYVNVVRLFLVLAIFSCFASQTSKGVEGAKTRKLGHLPQTKLCISQKKKVYMAWLLAVIISVYIHRGTTLHFLLVQKNTHCIAVILNGQNKQGSGTLQEIIQRHSGISVSGYFQDSTRQNQG